MKKLNLLLFLSLPVLLFSCQKSGVTDNPPVDPPVTSSYLSSARLYSSQTQLVDSFRYDGDHKLATWAQYYFDTTDISNPVADSQFYAFNFAANSVVPASYTLTYHGVVDPHVLSYDGQNRIVKDTSLSGSNMVVYFSYPNGNIASTVLFDGSAEDRQIDTLFLTNGDITEEKVYFPNEAGTADSLEVDLILGHGSYANPGYQSAVSGSVGPLLYILSVDGGGGYSDYISKHMITSIAGKADGLPGVPLNYTVTADGAGRVSQSLLSAGSDFSRTVFSYY